MSVRLFFPLLGMLLSWCGSNQRYVIFWLGIISIIGHASPQLENQLCHLDILQKSSNRPQVAWLIRPESDESAMAERRIILTNGPLELRLLWLSSSPRRSKNLKKLLRPVRGIPKKTSAR